MKFTKARIQNLKIMAVVKELLIQKFYDDIIVEEKLVFYPRTLYILSILVIGYLRYKEKR
jgi:hypothetical protein